MVFINKEGLSWRGGVENGVKRVRGGWGGLLVYISIRKLTGTYGIECREDMKALASNF